MFAIIDVEYCHNTDDGVECLEFVARCDDRETAQRYVDSVKTTQMAKGIALRDYNEEFVKQLLVPEYDPQTWAGFTTTYGFAQYVSPKSFKTELGWALNRRDNIKDSNYNPPEKPIWKNLHIVEIPS